MKENKQAYVTLATSASNIHKISNAGSQGGGGGDMGGRIARLEKDMDEVKSVLHRLEPVIARIDEKLQHIPNTWTFIGTVLVCVLAAMAIPGFLK